VYVGKSKVAELMKSNGLNHAFDPGKRRIEIPPADMLMWEPWRANYVWGLDWTWVNVGTSFMLLLIVVDWYSRKIIAWSFNWTITRFEIVACVTDAVAAEEIDLLPEKALRPIVVADHGSANTAEYTANNLKILGLNLWLSGIGRPTGNARTERTFGTIRREELALQDAYVDEPEARRRIAATLHDYNNFRPNAGNGGFAPNAVHVHGRAKLTEERNRLRRLTENQRREYWIKQQGHAEGVVT
jgi:putative transposase